MKIKIYSTKYKIRATHDKSIYNVCIKKESKYKPAIQSKKNMIYVI